MLKKAAKKFGVVWVALAVQISPAFGQEAIEVEERSLPELDDQLRELHGQVDKLRRTGASRRYVDATDEALVGRFEQLQAEIDALMTLAASRGNRLDDIEDLIDTCRTEVDQLTQDIMVRLEEIEAVNTRQDRSINDLEDGLGRVRKCFGRLAAGPGLDFHGSYSTFESRGADPRVRAELGIDCSSAGTEFWIFEDLGSSIILGGNIIRASYGGHVAITPRGRTPIPGVSNGGQFDSWG